MNRVESLALPAWFHSPNALGHWRHVAQAFSLLYRRLPVGRLLKSAKALQVENLRYSRLESLRYVVLMRPPCTRTDLAPGVQVC